MVRNHLKIALRQLAKNRRLAVINIGGMAIGLAASLLLGLFVFDELSFDRFHEHADRVVRVVFRAEINGGKIREPFAMPPAAAALKNDCPEVQEAARLRVAGQQIILREKEAIRGAEMAFVDAEFFKIFTLPLLQGEVAAGLAQPNSVVISENWAKRLFGSNDPVGQTIRLKNWDDQLRVVAVMRDIPANSHFQFDLFCSMANAPEAKSDSWMQSEFYTYLLLPEGYDYRKLEAKLPATVEKYIGPQLQAGLGMSFSEFKNKGNQLGLFLQPLTDIHLHSDFTFGLRPGGDVRYVWIFGAVAAFILLIACINFMNLSTASAAGRAREVGVRKAVGSSKASLVGRFLTESFLLTGLAFGLAIGFVKLAMPFFRTFTGKALSLDFMSNPGVLAALVVFWLVVGLFAGMYPAFFLSGFKPMAVLKNAPGATSAAGGHGHLRSGLVVTQFVISIGLMVATAVVFQQLSFIQHKKLGYDRTSVLVLENTGLLGARERSFREQLLQDPRVASISNSAFKPVGPSWNNNSLVYPDEKAGQLTRTLRYDVDENYIPTLGMKIVQGRNFSPDFRTDSSAIIINQTAAKTFGWADDAVGHTLHWANRGGQATGFQVIGVVEDFHFKSLHEPIAPLLMVLGPSPGLIVKTRAADATELLASVQERWAQLGTDEPLAYAFMDDYFQKTYVAEQKTGLVMGVFAGLTILIACLGLFGLAAFMAERRTKEIGIRKVLGASVASITNLLARDFLKLVLVAIVIASPLAYFFMQKWLADFAYRIDIQWWMFAGVGLVAVGIAFLTVSFQSVKAALADPVKSLRNE